MRRLQQEISSREFQELLAYAEMYGIPDSVGETAKLRSTIASCMSSRKEGWRPADFLPQRKTKMSSDQVLAVMRGWHNARAQ